MPKNIGKLGVNMKIYNTAIGGKSFIALAIAASLRLSACNSSHKNENTVNLRIPETSDLHTNIMDFNYYKGEDDPAIGFARVSSLIKSARKEVKNSVLVDNGDLLQGSPMGDYMADKFKTDHGLTDDHPAYKAMNLLDYDVANIGNHEFNFGLEFLDDALRGAEFPYTRCCSFS